MSGTSLRDDFIYDLRIVRKTRFAFSKRMEVKARVKTFVVNALSVIAIFISVYLLANASGIDELTLKRVSIAIIGVSLLALWMSLDTPAYELNRKAIDAHLCALRISNVYRKVKYGALELQAAIVEYEMILSEHPENHDYIDRKAALFGDRVRYPDKAKGLTEINTVWVYHYSCYCSVVLALLWALTVALVQVAFPL